MYGVILPVHNTLAGESLGPIPPIESGFLALSAGSGGGLILLDSGGFIEINVLVLRAAIMKLKQVINLIEKTYG